MTPSPSRAVRATYLISVALFVLSAAFAAFMAASIVTGVARHGDSLMYGKSLSVPMQMASEDLGPFPTGLRVEPWLDVGVEISPAATSEMLLMSAKDALPLALAVWALWLIMRLMRSVVKDDPFGSANVRRLRTLGSILVAGGLVVNFLNHAILNALYLELPEYTSIEIGAGPFSPLPLGTLLTGLIVFVFAEIFAHGSRLRDDVAGTI